jgi:multidrug resistance efflux pump
VTLAALVISVLSLFAVLLVGWRTVKSGEQSARASVDAAEASQRAAKATEAAVTASLRAAEATENTATLVASSTRERRLGGVIENLVRIRALFNEQVASFDEVASWTPEINSSEALARLSLCRELEGRLAPLTGEFGPESNVRALVTKTWDRATLESALQEAVNAIESV